MVGFGPRGVYPPKGAAKAEPVWGPIVLLILYFELCSRNVLRNVDIPRGNKIAKMLYFDGWTGGDILPPSIFLIFKYVNKQYKPVPNMCLKVAFAY